MGKRTFDIIVAGLALMVLWPAMLLIAMAIRLTSPGPVLYRQTRMGQGLKPFAILKFRTMVVDADKLGLPLTAGADPRITPIGRFLRKSKLDELPQLINVVKGDMSIVGPRPEVPKYVELFPQEFAEILQLRPGLTDLASIKYRDEAALLAAAADPEHEYQTRVLPDKLELARQYVEHSSLRLDVWLILRTIARVLTFSS